MLSNQKAIIIGRTLMVVLLSVILSDLIFSQLSGSLSDIFNGHQPAIISSILLMLLIVLNPRYFSFSDDHEFIQIQSHSGFWAMFQNRASINFDLPKNYIAGYTITGWGKSRRLNLQLRTSYREKSEYHFDIAFLTSSQIKSIHQSLLIVIERPQKKPHPDLTSVVNG